MDDFDMLSAPQSNAGNGVGAEEDPAAAFLAQQESEIAGIENDEGFSILDSGEVPSSLGNNLSGDQDAAGMWFIQFTLLFSLNNLLYQTTHLYTRHTVFTTIYFIIFRTRFNRDY